MSPTYALLVPVKSLARAKTRLEPGHRREPLMRAFALDALQAAAGCPLVARVYVVTDESGLDEHAVRLPDEGEGDLNRALLRAARRVRDLDPTTGVAAMCADLPALVTADLTAALGELPATEDDAARRRYVADAAGTGTTLLAAPPGVDLAPCFGPGSADLHLASGAWPVAAPVPTLRADVDTGADLDAARVLGLGRHTRRAEGAAAPPGGGLAAPR
ncbi:2-phospho-L-lactate guanylyltransferase [Nocardioides korecus]